MSDNHARTDLGITHHRVLIATKPLSLIRKLNQRVLLRLTVAALPLSQWSRR
jgi:hypothetical protein